MYTLQKIFLDIILRHFLHFVLQQKRPRMSSKKMGMMRRKMTKRNITYKFLIMSVESRSKAEKLSLKTKPSFSIPNFYSPFSMESSTGAMSN